MTDHKWNVITNNSYVILLARQIPRYNKPLYNEVLGITNNFASPSALCYIEVPLSVPINSIHSPACIVVGYELTQLQWVSFAKWKFQYQENIMVQRKMIWKKSLFQHYHTVFISRVFELTISHVLFTVKTLLFHEIYLWIHVSVHRSVVELRARIGFLISIRKLKWC